MEITARCAHYETHHCSRRRGRDPVRSYDENLKHSNRCSTSAFARRATTSFVEGEAPDRTRRAHRRSARVADAGRLQASNADVKTASDLVAQDSAVDLRDHFLKGSLTPPASGGSRRRPSTSAGISTRSSSTTSCSASARRAPARPTWRWRRPSPPGREEGQPYHPRAPGGRSGGEAGLSARRSAGKGESLSASALRCAVRHARLRARRATSSGAPSKSRRSLSCAAAR